MPFTKFNTLKLNIAFDRDDKDHLTMDEDVNVKLITNKYNINNNDSDTAITQYYHCFVSAGSNSTTQRTHQLNLTHVCNAT